MEEGEQSTKVVKRIKYVRCDVYGCAVNSHTHPEYIFYTVTKAAKARRDLWLKAIKAPYIAGTEIPKIQVCEKHFERKFINFNCPSRRLTKWAVPTLFLPENECGDLPNSEVESVDSDYAALNNDEEMHKEKVTVPNYSMTTDYIYPSIDKVMTLAPVKLEPMDPEAPSTSSCTYVTHVKRKQAGNFDNKEPTKLVKIKEEENCLTVFVEEDDEEEHENTEVANQLQDVAEFQNQKNVVAKEKSSKQKFSTEYKMCALELYFKSPNSYRLYQRTFGLPRISTLYRLCIPATTEVNQDVLTALNIKVKSMNAAQKECVVCVGTMSLSPTIEYDAVNDRMFGFQELDGVQTLEPARSILVIMVRGLFHNWKQALGFLFLSQFQNRLDVHRFIDEIIRKLTEIRLNVRVLMTDLESDMSSAARNRRFDVKSPFFFIGNKKIYYMYETLNLMKNVRDYFMHNSIRYYNGLVAQWLHLIQCYEYDRKKCLMRLAPKLSEDHVNVKEARANDDLKRTADIFSRATATAITTCVDLKVLEIQAKDTSLWILTMSQLLDILNFSTIDPPEDKGAVYSGTEKQVEFLVEMITMFSNLQTINASFKEGFMVTINALLLLYEELKLDYKDCLPIVGLSLDCLNKFFNKCREGLSLPPTAKQTVMTMTKLPICNIFQYSLKKRSPVDLERFLSEVRQMPDIDMYEEEYLEPYVDKCGAASAEFPAVPILKDAKVEHLALYLLYKGYREHYECEIMKVYVRSNEFIENTNSLVPRLVGYKTQTSSQFKMVPEEFMAFIEALEVKFKEYFKEKRLARSMAGLLSFVQNVTFEMPCACFPLDYIKQLYLRYRLYYVMEYNNAMFRTANCEASFVVNAF